MSQKITVGIVDDEYLGRKRIKDVLSNDDRFYVVQESGNPVDVLPHLRSLLPDVLFLDVEMPQLNGFDLVKSVSEIPKYKPLIVFVTAHASYALQGYEVHALDYLRKPFTDERLLMTLDRLAEAFDLRQTSQMKQEIKNVLNKYMEPQRSLKKLLDVKHNGVTRGIDLGHVVYFESYGNYIKIHLVEETIVHRMSLKELNDMLNPLHFTRISRFIIVRNNAIVTAKYKGASEYAFVMKDGKEVASTSLYKSKVQALLS
ncbi:MAG: response regulator transcription factor [Bacteroidia bacterium]|nr:response regulator transcription factor [Bacteroidia bacterium]